MDISNIVGLEKPLVLLLQSLHDGCSALFAPLMNHWQESLERKSLEKKNVLELEQSLKLACVEDLKDSIHTTRDRREIQNIVSIYTTAIKELKNLQDTSVPEVKSIDPDWSARFYDYAKDCSNEEIQILWAKILAGECCGKEYAKRTLWTLHNIETSEAKILVEIAPMLLDNQMIPLTIYDHQGIIGYNKILSLQASGCLNSSDCSLEFKNGSAIPLVGFKIEWDANMPILKFDGICLSASGRQLIGLIENISPNKVFIEHMKKYVENEFHGMVKILPN